MYIQNNDVNTLTPIWPTLDRVRRTLGFESKQMAELLELTPEEYQKYEKMKQEPLARSLLHLCRVLHISFDQFMNNEFCYRTMVRNFFGDKTIIPEKYVTASKTKRRVLVNILDFVEVASDYQLRLELMRHLQVNEAALLDVDATINLRCTMDAVMWLEHYSESDKLLRSLGREMMLSPQNYPVFSNLKGCRSIYQLFDALMSESGLLYTHFEKNFLWNIHKILPGQKIIVRGFINEETREQVALDQIQSRAGSLVRLGIGSAVPEILGWENIPVEISDFFEKSENFYEVEFDISKIIKTQPNLSLALIH